MFDFERLRVYQLSQTFNTQLTDFLESTNIEPSTKNQLKRAAESISLNIAEGTGKPTVKDKQRFYHIARGSVHECVAIFMKLMNQKLVSVVIYKKCYNDCEILSKMLYKLIANTK